MKEMEAAGTDETQQWRPSASRRWSEREARDMARAFAASGETKAEFARRHGLGEERIRRWLGQLAERDRRSKRPVFAPVRLVERARSGSGGVELVIGARVVRVGNGFCPETLRQVLAVIEDDAC